MRTLVEILEDACSALTTGDHVECHKLIHEARERAQDTPCRHCPVTELHEKERAKKATI